MPLFNQNIVKVGYCILVLARMSVTHEINQTSFWSAPVMCDYQVYQVNQNDTQFTIFVVVNDCVPWKQSTNCYIAEIAL
jgi:hypothetical protein